MISLESQLLDFFILDCASIEPSTVSFDSNNIRRRGSCLSFSVAKSIEEVFALFCRLQDNGLLIVDSESLSASRGVCDIRLTQNGGDAWSTFASPQWQKFTRVALGSGSRTQLYSLNKAELLRRAYEFVRYSTASKGTANLFLQQRANVKSVSARLVYWMKRSDLLKIVIRESDLDVVDEMQSIEEHMEWFASVVSSGVWHKYGFLERYCEIPLVDRKGTINEEACLLWRKAIRPKL